MNDRLQQFLAAENINQAQFADSIGVARASVSHILAGRNKPGYDFLLNMMRRYPELNIEWLLSGTGKMYKSRQDNEKKPVQVTTGSIDLFNGLDDLYGSTPEPPAVHEPAAPKIPETSPSTPQETDIPVLPATGGPNIAATERKNPEISPQLTQKQRSAVKIVIFYDDNTFQEF